MAIGAAIVWALCPDVRYDARAIDCHVAVTLEAPWFEANDTRPAGEWYFVVGETFLVRWVIGVQSR